MKATRIQLNVQLSPADVSYLDKEYGEPYFVAVSGGNGLPFWYSPLLYAIVIGSFLFVRLQVPPGLTPPVRNAIVTLVLASGLCLEIWYRRENWVQRKAVLRCAATSLQLGTQCTFDELGVHISSASAATCTPWNQVREVEETDHLVLLSLTGTRILILPKRCFPDSESLLAVRLLLRQLVKGSIRLRE